MTIVVTPIKRGEYGVWMDGAKVGRARLTRAAGWVLDREDGQIVAVCGVRKAELVAGLQSLAKSGALTA